MANGGSHKPNPKEAKSTMAPTEKACKLSICSKRFKWSRVRSIRITFNCDKAFILAVLASFFLCVETFY